MDNDEKTNVIKGDEKSKVDWPLIGGIVLILAFIISVMVISNYSKNVLVSGSQISGDNEVLDSAISDNVNTFTVNMNDYNYASIISIPTIEGNIENYEVTFYYNTVDSTSDGIQWSEIKSSKQLDAGTYYMYAKLVEKKGDNIFTTPTKEFTVNKAEGILKYRTTSVTKPKGAITASNTLTLTGDGSVSYTSSNSQIADVDEMTGMVTMKNIGDVMITAVVTDGVNYTYQNKSASYTIKIIQSSYYLMESDSTGDYNFYILGHNRSGCSNAYSPELIQTITIQNTLTVPSNYIAMWDVSSSNDGTIIAWLTKSSESSSMYDLYIGADLGLTEKIYAPTDSSFLFYKYLNCTEINGLKYLDTSKVTNMRHMFSKCEKVTYLDVTNFDTSKVTNMTGMFFYCQKLSSLDVRSFDTSNVMYMNDMFNWTNFKTIDLSNFDTSNVTHMERMFDYCSLTSIDLRNFNTSKVTDMGAMFYGCGNLTKLDLSSFDTSQVTDMAFMFHRCINLSELHLDKFNTSNVTSMSGMFEECTNLSSLSFNFDTSNVTDMSYMFYKCSNLKNMDLAFDTHKVTNMGYMFADCTSLQTLNLLFDTSNVMNFTSMFANCISLTNLYIDGFVIDKNANQYNMFYNCPGKE